MSFLLAKIVNSFLRIRPFNWTFEKKLENARFNNFEIFNDSRFSEDFHVFLASIFVL